MKRGPMNQRVISIHNRSFLIKCHQKSEALWIAAGSYNDKLLQETGATKEEAYANWQRVVSFLIR